MSDGIESNPQRLLTPKQTAEYLSVGISTLANWRLAGKGPKFYKLGTHMIRYKKQDLDDFVQSQEN